MADQVQYRRGTSAQHASFTGAAGEATIDTDQELWRVHDGATAGGIQGARSLSPNTLTGANQSYTLATLWTQTKRSNSGTPMVDTGQTLSAMAGVKGGALIYVGNSDATASLTITAGASTTWNGAASIIIAPGRAALFAWDGTSNFQALFSDLSINGPWAIATSKSVTSGSPATLSAANMVPPAPGGRLILLRSGPSAGFTDTTDTATAIIAAMAGAVVGSSYELTIINTSAQLQTINGGTGVTLTGALDSSAFTVGPNSSRTFTVAATNVGSPAVAIYG